MSFIPYCDWNVALPSSSLDRSTKFEIWNFFLAMPWVIPLYLPHSLACSDTSLRLGYYSWKGQDTFHLHMFLSLLWNIVLLVEGKRGNCNWIPMASIVFGFLAYLQAFPGIPFYFIPVDSVDTFSWEDFVPLVIWC